MQRQPHEYFGIPAPRKNVLKLLEKELQAKKFEKQIWLSFIGDVYCQNTDDSNTTREALKLLNYYNAPVAVISKNPKKMLRDLDVFKEFGDRIMVGTTLTFMDEQKSKYWEPDQTYRMNAWKY